MNIKIRRATREDLPVMRCIYRTAKRIMDASGNPGQWTDGYPGDALLLRDLERDTLYVVEEEGRIRGCFVLAPGEDPTYKKIYEGSWSCDAPYATVHRLAGDGQGGIFEACMAFAKERYGYLRIDTHRDNRIMLHLLEKSGFRRCGIICLENGSERIAFDCERKSPAS